MEFEIRMPICTFQFLQVFLTPGVYASQRKPGANKDRKLKIENRSLNFVFLNCRIAVGTQIHTLLSTPEIPTAPPPPPSPRYVSVT